MTITTSPTGVKTTLDNGNPNSLPSLLQLVRVGSLLRASKTQKMGMVPAADPYQLATLQSLGLTEDAKAATILRAYARSTSGAGTLGELAVQAYGATPADGQIAVAPNGDIVVLASSAYTAIDVYYDPMQYDVQEFTLPVVTGVLTLPTKLAGKVVALLEAEVLTGTVTGKKIVLVPASGLPATTKAQLNVAKTAVSFNNATDAPTTARVKLAVALEVARTDGLDTDTLLTGAANTP